MTTTAQRSGGGTAQADAAARQIEEIRKVADADLPQAIAMAARAWANGVTHPLLHHMAALQLKHDGRLEEAVAELGRGLELDPRDGPMIITLGFCLIDLERLAPAAKMFELALKLNPNSPPACYGYGWAAEGMGALDAAQSAWRRAVALDPAHADAWAGLSGLAARRREWSDAKTSAEKALALDPRQTDAMMNLARIDMGLGDPAGAARRVKETIDLPFLKPLARASCKIMLGDALDAQGRHQEAFAAYKEGKSDTRALFADVYEAPDRMRTPDEARRMTAEFLDTPPAAWARPATGGLLQGGERGHAFLMGFPRSGTTLLEQVLETHPDVVSLDERPLLMNAEMEFLAQPGGVKRLADVLPLFLEPFQENYWRAVRELGVDPTGKVFVDKYPLATVRLPLISKVFPNAKIIFAVRDPRDVVFSCFRRGFNMNPAMYEFNTLEGAARFYDAVMRAGEAYFERLPLDVHRVKYEDLVADFDAVTRGVCEFIGVDWTDDLRNFARTIGERRIATPSSVQIARGLYTEGAGQWRPYAFALAEVMPILQPWIERFGYEPA
jgi:tetratricopeptide (TPR) repeat protein